VSTEHLPEPSPRTLACPACITWVKEAEALIVVNEQRGERVVLRGLECAVWSWLSLGYAWSDLACFTAEACEQSIEDARRSVAAVLEGWLKAGLLEEVTRARLEISPGLSTQSQTGGEYG
jgi:hypothetical protein